MSITETIDELCYNITGYDLDLSFLYISLEIQVLISFITSLLLAPFSDGIVFFFLFVYLFEIFRTFAIQGYSNLSWNYAITRLSIILSSALGWWIGRMLVEDSNPASQAFDLYYWTTS